MSSNDHQGLIDYNDDDEYHQGRTNGQSMYPQFFEFRMGKGDSTALWHSHFHLHLQTRKLHLILTPT